MCESQPGSRSVFSNIRAWESDGNPLSRRDSNQMHVQPIPHLFFALFTAKIYQLLTLLTAGQFTAHDVLRRLHADACTICCMQPPNPGCPGRRGWDGVLSIPAKPNSITAHDMPD